MRCDTYLYGAPRVWSLGPILVTVKLVVEAWKFDLTLAPAEGVEWMDWCLFSLHSRIEAKDGSKWALYEQEKNTMSVISHIALSTTLCWVVDSISTI